MVDVRAMVDGDARAVLGIYGEGIAAGDATFEQAVPTWDDWDARHLPAPRLVAAATPGPSRAVVGWAALSPVSERCVYAGVAEVSVYVGAASRGRGIGRLLLASLVDASEREGIWTLQAGVFPENAASIALYAACGFRVVGRRERLGRLGGRWRDVLLLERRSGRVGR